MPTPIRLLAEPQSDQRTVQFYAAFPAPASDAAGACNPAGLFTGDPQTGLERTKIAETAALCAPTAVTWVSQRQQALGAMTYASPGVHQATLRWGDAIATVSFTLGEQQPEQQQALPILTLFEVKPTPAKAPDSAVDATVRVQATGLAPDQQVRVDTGAGQVFVLPGKDGPDAHGEWSLVYAKMGEYSVTVDLLDGEGYWLATLAQNPLEIVSPVEEPALIGEPEPGEPIVAVEPLVEVPTATETNPPWLPYRYVRPMWGGVRTYRTPGGGASRVACCLEPIWRSAPKRSSAARCGTNPPMATGLRAARWLRCNLLRCVASSCRAAHHPLLLHRHRREASGTASSRPRCLTCAPGPVCRLIIHRSPSCPVARR